MSGLPDAQGSDLGGAADVVNGQGGSNGVELGDLGDGSPRLSLGPIAGGAVRLAPANERQRLVMIATGLPTLAALSAGGIEKLILPPLPMAHHVIIAANHDSNGVGERAGRIAAEGWLTEGRRVRLTLPPEPDTDWNDVLLSKDGEARDAA